MTKHGPTHFVLIFFICLLLAGEAMSQPGVAVKLPKDDFSRAFLYVYSDAASSFHSVRGKEINTGTEINYACRKAIPGCRSAMVRNDEASCIYDFGSYQTLEDAQATMLRLTNKVTHALSGKVMVRYIDSSEEPLLIKRTAIAEVKDGGFYGYNIVVDVLKNRSIPGEFSVKLVLKGGEGIFYRFIHRNEPLRSPYFKRSFARIYSQFNEAPGYTCLEQLPGFVCQRFDSSGKQQLMMEKKLSDLPDGRVEFECLTSSFRALLGDHFLYYFPSATNEMVKQVVFVRFADHAKNQRKSISAALVQNGVNDYAIRVMMYHP
jgi:hypothetical protein